KMEERIIVSVCGHPEINYTNSYSYRDRTNKEIAWKKNKRGNETIRRKWKGLRDTYVREKKKETEKKSGSGASQGKKWKYFAVLSFLDPFVTPRETSSNMGWGVEENRTVEYTTEVTLPGRNEDTIKRLLLECLQRTSPPPALPPTEDELFFQSLLPSLQRLPPQQK
uniref:MADF domain-containing protein n=1 Tax=Sinocyclocheilus rhinocerous TaxID=307959 RepID=A0A673I220_9TELE